MGSANIGTLTLDSAYITAYQKAIQGLSAEQAVFALKTKGATAAQIEEIMTTESATLAKGTYTQADIQAALAKHGLTEGIVALTAAQQTELLNSGALTSEKLAEIAATLGLETAENGALISKEALTVAQVKEKLSSIGVIGAQQEQILSLLGLTAAEAGSVSVTNLLTAAWNRLKAAIASHPIGALLVAFAALIALAVKVKDAINDANQEAIDKINETRRNAKTAMDESSGNLQKLESQLSEINDKLEEVDSSIMNILKKPSITLVDRQELDKLIQAKQLLLENQKIAELTAKTEAKSKAATARQYLKTDVGTDDAYTFYSTGGAKIIGTGDYKSLYNAAMVQMQANMRNYIAALKKNQNTKSIEKYINLNNAETFRLIQDIRSALTNMQNADGTIVEGYEQLYKQYSGYLNNLQAMVDPDQFWELVDTFNLSDIDVTEEYNKIQAMIADGSFSIDKVDSDFIQALASHGIDKDTIDYIFQNKQQQYNDLISVIDQKYPAPKAELNLPYDATGALLAVVNSTFEAKPVQYMDESGIHTDREATAAAEAKARQIQEAITSYANDHPAEFKILTSFDGGVDNLHQYLDEEYAKTKDWSKAVSNSMNRVIQDYNADQIASKKMEAIRNGLLAYSKKNPIDFQQLLSFDTDLEKFDSFVDEEFQKTKNYETAVTNALERIKEDIVNFEIPEEDKISFADLVKTEDFHSNVSAFQNDLSLINETIDKIDEGSLSETDKLSLFDKFPELASQSDDLRTALINLRDGFETDAIEMFDGAMKYMASDEDRAALQSYIDTFLNIADSAETAAESVDKFNTVLDDLESTYSDIKGVIDNYNDNGYLTLDNLQTIMDLEPQYVNLLIDENGQINLNNAAYKEYVATKAKSLLVEQLKDLYSTVLNMKLEEAQAYANAEAYDTETRSINDLLTATTELYMVQAQSKDSANNTTAYTDAMKRSFSTAANYAAMVDSYINSLSTSESEFSTSTEEATSALEAQKDALEDQKDSWEDYKDSLEDAKDALEDYKDELENAQDRIQSLIDLMIEYIKQTKENEKDALQDSIDSLKDKKDALDDQMNAYSELISKRKEEIETLYEEKEAQDELAEKQKSLAKSALALAVANLDDSSAGKKAQKQAQDDYLSSEKDLKDYLAEKEKDKLIAALEEEEERYKQMIEKQKTAIDKQVEYIESKIDEIDVYLEKSRRIYEDACRMIDNDNGTLYSNLWNYTYEYTTKTRTEFDNLWSSAQAAIQRYKGDNDTLIGTMETLQQKIYDTDGEIANLNTQIDECETQIGYLDDAIDATSNAISATSKSIDEVSSSISGLGDSISYYLSQLNKVNGKTTISFTKNGRSFETDQEYEHTEAGLSAAAKELAIKYVNTPGTEYYNDRAYGTLVMFDEIKKVLLRDIPHFAKGTYSSPGGLSVTQDKGLEDIFEKLPNGKYTLMNKGSHVFNAEATENLHRFMDDPTEFMSQHTQGYDYSGWLKSNYGNYDSAIKSISENVSNITGDTSISTPVTITIQGDATQSTVNAIKKESDKIKDAIINDITRVREKQRRATIR